ncbi:predicted protein [Uncinocarpus reesii 1704]|uniref:Uncharacterized protein n=1 Tax=Uncinocarpus reesii (strain UAMH 1704) TaxID=336963 RepID=C4JEK5_UNCRE|nr:uncharacterized protein UREG_00844 [Uncinocarpus reesii 1704]EEP75997.1 predicted protein [Uncinocarpus reesii 1704]
MARAPSESVGIASGDEAATPAVMAFFKNQARRAVGEQEKEKRDFRSPRIPFDLDLKLVAACLHWYNGPLGRNPPQSRSLHQGAEIDGCPWSSPFAKPHQGKGAAEMAENSTNDFQLAANSPRHHSDSSN